MGLQSDPPAQWPALQVGPLLRFAGTGPFEQHEHRAPLLFGDLHRRSVVQGRHQSQGQAVGVLGVRRLSLSATYISL